MQKKTTKTPQLKVGVIGLGMGQGHVKRFNTHPDCKVVAIADMDKIRLEACKEKEGVEKGYTDGFDMISKEKLDIICVATPNKFHMPYTIAALESGAHVLCEKPMAMNAEEARKMNAAAKKANKRIMIDFSYRFGKQIWALKGQVDSGLLGDVYYGRTTWLRRRGIPNFGGWFGQKELAGGGPLIDLGVHRVDMALWLMGYPKPVSVMGVTAGFIGAEMAKKQNKKYDVEDFAAGFVKFENGAALSVEASWASNIKENDRMVTELLGTKGGIKQYNLDEGYEFEAEIYIEREGLQYDMKLHPPIPDAPIAMHHFADAILNDTPHTATGEEGLIVMEILDALYESAATGKPVNIKR
ncbi:MAG: Gfo/Idh/MocA family oxidoreductase [bacterium]|jgi:predicted dehydrogenase